MKKYLLVLFTLLWASTSWAQNVVPALEYYAGPTRGKICSDGTNYYAY